MNRLDDLMAELAPSGIQFKAIGDICAAASKVRWSNVGEDEFQYIDLTSVDRAAHKIGNTVTVSAKDAPSRAQQIVHTGDVIFATTRPAQMRWAVVPREYDSQVASTGYCVLRPDTSIVLTDFLAHVVGARVFRDYIEANQVAGNYPSIPDSRVRAHRIPVPPLEVQREIASILGHFTDLEAELEAELAMRKKQRLGLSVAFSKQKYSGAFRPPRKVQLGEVATRFVSAVRVKPEQNYTTLGVKWYGEGVFARPAKPGRDIKGSVLYETRPGQFIYNRMFVTEGSFALVTPAASGGVVSGEFPVYDLDTSRVLPEWLLWQFRDEFTLARIAAETTGTERGSMKSRRRWKEQQFEAFEVELPPIEEQREIANALGAVVNLEECLAAEIAARRKQYEYYRDKLLTFEEAPA